jgi:auxin efflux carrier family protein
MHPLQGAITQAGNCSIPITLIVLGAYFHQPPEKPETPTSTPSSTASWQRASFADSLRDIFRLQSREHERQPSIPHRSRKGEEKAIFVVILSRMVIVPALFLPFIAIGARRTHPPVFQE